MLNNHLNRKKKKKIKALLFTFTDLWGGNNLTLAGLKIPVFYLPDHRISENNRWPFCQLYEADSYRPASQVEGLPAGERLYSTVLEGNHAAECWGGEGWQPLAGHVLQLWSRQGNSPHSSNPECRNGGA